MISAGIVVTGSKLRKEVVDSLQNLGVRIAFAVDDASGQAHLIESTNPDLLVLDFSRPETMAVMADLKSLDAPVAVIAVHSLGEPEAILAALRLGAREFLWPPLNQTALRNAVRAIDNEKIQREMRRRSATAVGFLASTGGCGATTIACHVAAELRRSGAGQVGLLDFDLQAGMAGFWFGTNSSYSILDAVHNVGRMDPSLWRGYVSTVQPQLDVLAAPAEIPLGGQSGVRGFVEVLRFARSQYDWVVADLAAHLTPLSMALLEDLETVYLVSTPEVAALLQTRRIIQRLVDIGYSKEKLKVLVSRVQKEQVVSLDDLKNMIGLPVTAVFLSDSVEIAEAHSSGRLMTPKSDFGKRIAQFSVKLTGKPAETPRPSKFSLFRFRAQEG
jgi:pilus assembly protein CpaE